MSFCSLCYVILGWESESQRKEKQILEWKVSVTVQVLQQRGLLSADSVSYALTIIFILLLPVG